jgi:hypothetical protein
VGILSRSTRFDKKGLGIFVSDLPCGIGGQLSQQDPENRDAIFVMFQQRSMGNIRSDYESVWKRLKQRLHFRNDLPVIILHEMDPRGLAGPVFPVTSLGVRAVEHVAQVAHKVWKSFQEPSHLVGVSTASVVRPDKSRILRTFD